jgi:hypothetical protein
VASPSSRGAGHAGNDEPDAGEYPLGERSAKYSVDHAGDGVAGNGQHLLAAFADNPRDHGDQALAEGFAVAKQEEGNEDAERQFQHPLPEGLASGQQGVLRKGQQALEFCGQPLPVMGQALPVGA